MGEGGGHAQTQVVVRIRGIGARADDVRTILGAGRVYVGGRATGVANVTVVVGEGLAGD
jgi:hypothetical protein